MEGHVGCAQVRMVGRNVTWGTSWDMGVGEGWKRHGGKMGCAEKGRFLVVGKRVCYGQDSVVHVREIWLCNTVRDV